jgi:hypothetical protein
MADTINTDLSQYSIDELFNLFEIKITQDTTYESLTKQIYENGMKMIKLFKNKNDNLATFFEKATNYLLENKSLLTDNYVIQNPNHYQYGEIVNRVTNSMNDYMFNGNNGAGNPIHRKTVTKLFNIDSRFRYNYDTTSSTNFTVQLNIEQKNVIEMKLCDLEIPTTFYPISTVLGNNYMWIKFIKNTIDDMQNKYVYIHIPDGNYYFEDLISYINGINCLKQLDDSTVASIKIDLNYNNGGGVGTGTGKIRLGIFTDTDLANNDLSDNQYTSIELNFNGSMLYEPFTANILKKTVVMNISEMKSIYGGNRYTQVSNIDVQNNFGWLLGFKKKLYTGSIDYIAEGVMDILGPRYLFLVIDDGISSSVNTNFFAASGKGIDSNTIARISLKSPPFNIQTQNDFSVYTEPRYYFGPVTISKFNISLRDEYNRIVDLNKNDMSFTLRLTIIYSD